MRTVPGAGQRSARQRLVAAKRRERHVNTDAEQRPQLADKLGNKARQEAVVTGVHVR